MKKLFSFRSKKSTKPPIASAAGHQHPSSEPNTRPSSPIDHRRLSYAARATSSFALATTGTLVPSQSNDPQHIPRSRSPAQATAVAPTDNDQLTIPASPLTEDKPGWKTTAYSTTKMALEVVKESSDAFLPLKSVVGGISILLRQYDQYISNKDDVQRLIIRVESLAAALTGSDDFKEITRRRDLESKLHRVLQSLDWMSKQSDLSGFLNNSDQAAKITSLVEDIRDAIIDYQTSLQQDINKKIVALIESSDLKLLNKLQRAKDAGHTSGNREKCLRQTRVKVLEEIENWLHQIGIRRVYWLNGVAGVGKSTIAQSLADRWFAEDLLGASFFCSRDFPDRRNLRFIFPTLAFQLAYKYPAFRAHLVNSLRYSPDAAHGSLEHQLKTLLVEPLQSTGLSTVIVIDALDECEDDKPASAILSLLSRSIDQIPSVKFFITGRPEPQIRSGFRLPALRPQTEILLLHEVESRSVDEDIRLFFEYHLGELAKTRSDMDITTPWPIPDDVRIITSKAGGLFIYASTVIRFVSSSAHSPQERLQMIISLPDSRIYGGQLGIDPLYSCMFERSCTYIHPSDLGYFSRLSLVVGSVVLLCEPVSVASLATLVGMGSKAILTSIRSLHSVLLVPDSDSEPIRVFHKSFPDYITDYDRCKDSRFYVDSPVHHARLAVGCFELMNSGLRTNICSIPQYAMNDDIEDLASRQEQCIGEDLLYGCRFWSKHLCSASRTGNSVAQMLELLKRFLERQLLQWLEVLSIVNGLGVAVHSLADVEQWLVKVKDSSNEELLNMIRECRRFVLHSFDAIQQSAAHIYDSALLWAPTTSLIRTLYSGQLRSQVKLLKGIDESWDSCTRAVPLGDSGPVRSVFSHQGDLIAGYNGRIIKVLEATTGVCLAALHGHNEEVFYVAFSSDDVFLASGSRDKTVRVWDVQTGGLVKTLEGHTQVIVPVAFSPSGTLVASGSYDCTIRIWKLPSGDCSCILKGSSGGVLSVCWLRTNQVVSGDVRGKVKVWDVPSGECLKTFDHHSNMVWSVASSPDSSKIASGSNDHTIAIRDSQTGVVSQTIHTNAYVNSICFDPEGDKILYATTNSIVVWDLVKGLEMLKWQQGSTFASPSPDWSCFVAGSWDGFARIFQMEPGHQDGAVFDQHSSAMKCVASSTDGQMIATASNDKTIKLWDPITGLCANTLHSSSDLSSVAFSPDSSLLAVGDGNGAVQIWSLHDHAITTTLKGHIDQVNGIKFSSNGKCMVSLSPSHEVILWDVEKQERLAYLPNSATSPEYDSQVSFSADGTGVILQFRDVVKSWKIIPNGQCSSETAGSQSSKPSSQPLPMLMVPTPDDVHIISHDSVQPYRHRMGSEWIVDPGNRRVCWIPADRRFSDSYGNKLFLGTTSGRLVVVDLSDVVM